MAFGERLRLARLRAGMSMAALANSVEPKITAQAVNKYEKGEMMPSSSVLVGLAKTLGVSLDFLMSQENVVLDSVSFRKRASTTEKERALVEAEVLDHVERYLAIEHILDLQEEPSDLDRINQREIEDVADAESVASDLRDRWNLGGDPIPSITALLEEKNTRVMEIGGHDKFFGLTCHVARGDKPSIRVVVRRNVNVERNRFTMAHELAHALISHCRNGNAEKAMDRFAGAFLIPAEHLKNEIGQDRSHFAFQELVRLKHLYGVSMWALIYRLRDVEIISEATMKNLYKTPARAWLKTEPAPLEESGDIGQLEKPRRFHSHVYRALAEGLIPATKAAALLRQPIGDVEKAVKFP